MSKLDYLHYFQQQGRVCAICKEPPAPGTCLHWDHDHGHCPGKTGCPKCVRALLCRSCNSLVAVVESRVSLAQVVSYLTDWALRRGV